MDHLDLSRLFWENFDSLSGLSGLMLLPARYARPMSRNAVVRDNAGETFAGLLEHLTRHAAAERVPPEPERLFRSGFRREAGSTLGAAPKLDAAPGAASDTRPAERSLLPVRELKAGHTTSSDSMPLSYEKALRRHARYKGGIENDLDLSSPESNAIQAPPLPLPTVKGASAAKPKAAREPLQGKRPKPAVLRKETSPDVRKAAASVHPAAKTESNLPRSSGNALRSAAVERASAPSNPSGTARKVRGNELSTMPARKRSKRDGPTTVQAGHGLEQKAGNVYKKASKEARNRARKLTPDHARRVDRGSSQIVPERRMLPGKVDERFVRRDLESLQLEPLRPLGQLQPLRQAATLEQRRMIVSVRLTEDEFERLRDRAGESGVSVSGYMRSCVVEADQLRMQVKRALTEMRSLGARPVADHHTAALGGTASTRGGAWFRLLVRTATVFLSPLFPSRRTTSLARAEVSGSNAGSQL